METLIRNIKNEPLWSALKNFRKEIFVEDQGLDISVVEDEHDNTCTHIIYTLSNQILASCRIRSEEHIGYIERVSVAKPHRNQSLGTQLMIDALDYLETIGVSMISLFSQIDVCKVYEKHGFKMSGDPFILYGRTHIKMIKYFEKKEKRNEEK